MKVAIDYMIAAFYFIVLLCVLNKSPHLVFVLVWGYLHPELDSNQPYFLSSS